MRMGKEWKTAVLVIFLLMMYTLYKVIFNFPVKRPAPIRQDTTGVTPKPVKWVYNPTKEFPKEWYAIPKVLDKTCTPKENFYFLRTHQTGTSSVTNIFYRYGQVHELNYVMYPLKLHLHYPSKMNMAYLESVKPPGGYNILCQYTRHKQMDVFRVMPEGTIFTTLLRHPVDQFLSAFHHFDMKSQIRNLQQHHNPYQEFFRNPDKVAMMSSDAVFHLIQNSMSFDLGLEPMRFKEEKYVDEFVKRIDEEFHLIMILEMLDESLVLFRRIMCWKLSDMIYIKLSINNDYSMSISDEIRQKIIDWNSVDYKLYTHFHDKMKRIVAEQDEDFHKEVAMLKQMNGNFSLECYANILPIYSGNKLGYVLTESHAKNLTCKTLATDDVTQTHIIALRQFKAILAPSDVLMVRNHMQNLRKNNMAMLEWTDVNDVLHPIDDTLRDEL